MHRLLFLEPAHFHAALTLRVSNPRVADEVVVYAPNGTECREFLALLERFNRRAERPTRWRAQVVSSADLCARLIDERRGGVVVLAGKNGGKAPTIRRLHDAGFHVLGDKPWLVRPDDLDHIRASLAGGPLAMEIMTGRHDVATQLFKRVVDTPAVFGDFRRDGPGIETASVHYLEKQVDGAPLRRPFWYFDVGVQGNGAVDIPTHLVDQSQWLTEGRAPGAAPTLLRARVWSTLVPLDAFRRITGEARVPPSLQPIVYGDALDYRCNAQLDYRIGDVVTRASARWELSARPNGGDTSRLVARGTGADVWREQSPETGHRRCLLVEPRNGDPRPLLDLVDGWRSEMPGIDLKAARGRRWEIVTPPGLDGGHEAHFALALDAFLDAIDAGGSPGPWAERTLAKYALLAAAAAQA